MLSSSREANIELSSERGKQDENLDTSCLITGLIPKSKIRLCIPDGQLVYIELYGKVTDCKKTMRKSISNLKVFLHVP